MSNKTKSTTPAVTEEHYVGLNIITRLEGSILTIQCDLSQTHGPSSSGKTLIVASSKGNVQVPEAPDVMMGVNLYRYAEKKAK